MKPGHAPTPFTAEEIRNACPQGTAVVLRRESMDQVVTVTHTFAKCDEEGADVELTVTNEEGKELGKQTKRSSWKEMQEHASFPEPDTKITEETVEVPAGKFECLLYTVVQDTAGKRIRKSMHFAKKLPGPPVKMVFEMDGKVQFTMTLVERKAAAPKDEKKPDEKQPDEDPDGKKPDQEPAGS
jgi:hypothetical protein